MKFFELVGIDNFAGYVGLTTKDEDAVSRPEAPQQVETNWSAPMLYEYMGDPPRKRPFKKGHYHQAGMQHYFSTFARQMLGEFLEPVGVFRRVNIVGRDDEIFFRYWCNKVVDCLDLKRSVISNINPKPNLIGVVKTPVFDNARWDGSNVFRVPGDGNHVVYCSERFVEECRKHKINGMKFCVGLFDPDPIEIR